MGASRSSTACLAEVMEMLPKLRTEECGPPIYDSDSVKFSIEMHHGGFFIGKGINLAYLDEKVAWFDNLDRNTFGNDMIDYMLGQLNYPRGDLDIVFWCPPGKTISEMVAIRFEVDYLKMAQASIILKMLVLFVKHIEEMMEKAKKKKSKMVVDESGDADFPVILTHIKHKTMRPQMDPTQVKESMVHILSHEGPAEGVPINRAHRIPEESAFVVQSRTNISVHPTIASTTTGGRGAHPATT
ncbi:hypothetical protein D1007_50742 [Hordeum vulgare]|nr:hypothetical protein D1007_50742 [Hordeum vulgare]